jgi:hypothetical protein
MSLPGTAIAPTSCKESIATDVSQQEAKLHRVKQEDSTVQSCGTNNLAKCDFVHSLCSQGCRWDSAVSAQIKDVVDHGLDGTKRRIITDVEANDFVRGTDLIETMYVHQVHT